MILIMPHPSAFIATLLFFAEVYDCWIRFALQVYISSQLQITTTAIPFSFPQLDCQGNIMHSSELHWPQFGSAGML